MDYCYDRTVITMAAYYSLCRGVKIGSVDSATVLEVLHDLVTFGRGSNGKEPDLTCDFVN